MNYQEFEDWQKLCGEGESLYEIAYWLDYFPDPLKREENRQRYEIAAKKSFAREGAVKHFCMTHDDYLYCVVYDGEAFLKTESIARCIMSDRDFEEHQDSWQRKYEALKNSEFFRNGLDVLAGKPLGAPSWQRW